MANGFCVVISLIGSEAFEEDEVVILNEGSDDIVALSTVCEAVASDTVDILTAPLCEMVEEPANDEFDPANCDDEEVRLSVEVDTTVLDKIILVRSIGEMLLPPSPCELMFGV